MGNIFPIHFNTNIIIDRNQLIKYGVVEKKYFISDLLEWNMLLCAGRMQKPTQFFMEAHESNAEIRAAIKKNLESAFIYGLIM